MESPAITISLNCLIDPALPTVPDRIRHLDDLCRDRIQGFELHMNRRLLFGPDKKHQEEILGLLAGRRACTVHLVVNSEGEDRSPAHEEEFMAGVRDFLPRLRQSAGSGFKGIVAHPDDLDSLDAYHGLCGDGYYVSLEVMGKYSPYGNSVAYMQDALGQYPGLQLTLDLAHAMETAAQGKDSVQDYVANLSRHIRQVHISQPGDLYDRALVGDDFWTYHSLLCLGESDGPKGLEAVGGLPGLIMTVEGVIPPGPEGDRMLLNELSIIENQMERGTR